MAQPNVRRLNRPKQTFVFGRFNPAFFRPHAFLCYNEAMKVETTAKVGVLDALATGLAQAGRRPWLCILLAAIDGALWLAPRLSVKTLLQHFLVAWEALLRATYPAAQLEQTAELVASAREMMALVGSQINLAALAAGGWPGVPSAVANQSTRMTFVGDTVLASAGLGLNLPPIALAPWQPAPVEMSTLTTSILAAVACWLIGQFVMSFYLRYAAAQWQGLQTAKGSTETLWPGWRGLGRLTLQLAATSLAVSVLVFGARLPVSLLATVLFLSGSPVAAALYVIVGGVTLWLLLWFLVSFFFAGEGILLDQLSPGRAVWQSVMLVRFGGWSILGLVLTINLVMLGFRAVWGLIGQTPAGSALSILGNAYLATGMLLGAFTYYHQLRSRWQAQAARGTRPLAVSAPPGPEQSDREGK